MVLISHLFLLSGVFTELISEIGVEDVQVEELWSFDLETLKSLEYLFLLFPLHIHFYLFFFVILDLFMDLFSYLNGDMKKIIDLFLQITIWKNFSLQIKLLIMLVLHKLFSPFF